MSSIRTLSPVVVCLSLLIATKGSTQVPPTVANLYIQAKTGVYVYSANTQGQLTPVNGSPFYDKGQMEGVNGAYLISVGTNYLHSYHLAANGGVGAQAGQVNTQSYSGASCGTTTGLSLLDHTGQSFDVQLYGASSTNGCAALQTYKIGSDGEFTFLGDSYSGNGVHGMAYQTVVSTYSSNDLYAYGVQGQQGADVFLAYTRTSAGDLVSNGSFTQTGPQPDPGPSGSPYFPQFVAADNAGHLAAVLYTPFSNSTSIQVGSFTINPSTGAIQSTNTYANMPVLQILPSNIAMSWGGNYLAVSGAPGMQVFHFNGAAPPTAFGGILQPKVVFDQVAWDKNNHLYALSYSSQQLYVYTVTSTGITQAPGSPYKTNQAYGVTGMIVVPKP